MPQLDIALAPQNDARRATILSLPPQIEADVLPRDLADAVRGLWRGGCFSLYPHSFFFWRET
jgi:guanine nucleotide-binding protein subunit alpha